MKKTVIALTVLGAAAMVAANATQYATPMPGSFYVGLQAGWGHASLNSNNSWNTAYVGNAVSDSSKYTMYQLNGWQGKKNQFVGGIYGGYQFTPYFAVELGSEYFSSIKQNAGANLNQEKLEVMPYLTMAIKGDYPIVNNLDVFGEVGGAIVYSKLDVEGAPTSVTMPDATEATKNQVMQGSSWNQTRFAPLLELGLEYAITPHISARLADQVLINATNYNGAKNTENSVLVGISYRFGNQTWTATKNSEANMSNMSNSHSMMNNNTMTTHTMTTNTNVGTVTTTHMTTTHKTPANLTSGMTVENYNKLQGAQAKDLMGVIVTNVQPNSNAYNFGLRSGDIITMMNGYKVANVAQLSQLARIPQATTTMTVVRGEGGQVIKLENTSFNIAGKTLFDFNRANLTSAGQMTLNTMLNKIKASGMENPIFTVNGYTDPIGSPQYNLVLSQRRANTVAQYLASQGVPSQDIHAVGYGETHLIVTQAQFTKDHKPGETLREFFAPNRRVTVTVTGIVNQNPNIQSTDNITSVL